MKTINVRYIPITPKAQARISAAMNPYESPALASESRLSIRVLMDGFALWLFVVGGIVGLIGIFAVFMAGVMAANLNPGPSAMTESEICYLSRGGLVVFAVGYLSIFVSACLVGWMAE